MLELKQDCKCGETVKSTGIWITMNNSAIVLFECDKCFNVWTEVKTPDYNLSEIGNHDRLEAYK